MESLVVDYSGTPRRTFVLVAVVVVVVALPLLWLALQTLGGKSSKVSAVAASLLSF